MSYRSDFEPRSAMPPVIKWLLIANGLVFFMQHLRGEFLMQWLALWPNFERTIAMVRPGVFVEYPLFKPWQLLTYGFMHSTANLLHIAFNMFALWMFGQQIEESIGPRRFLLYYLACVLGAGLCHIAWARYAGSPYPVVGASGGVYGVLLAFGMLFPRAEIRLLLFPVPIEARFLVLIYGGIELLSGVLGTSTGVAHFAHLGGMLTGYIILLFWMRKGGDLRRW